MSQFFNYPLEVASAAETLCMDWCTKEPVLALSTNDGRISFFQDEVRLSSPSRLLSLSIVVLL